MKIVFLGGGNMANALIGGMVKQGFTASDIDVIDLGAEARAKLSASYGVTCHASADTAPAAPDILVLAVKPQQMGSVVEALRPAFAPRAPLLLSVAAGIRVADLRRWAGTGVGVVRSMPNRPALIGAGASGLYADADLPAAQRDVAMAVMAATGLAVWVERESDLDLVTALSGSGPAYFFLLAELMAQAAEQQGLSATVARQLAAQTLAGAGQLVAAEARPDLARMREQVTSKGGTTEAALRQFAQQHLDTVVSAAMQAAAQRSAELAEQFGKA